MSPAGRQLGERVRELLLAGPPLSAWAEAALFAAARAELVAQVIRPALERGADVVCDRYVDSSLAYQGIARGLGVERVLELNDPATGGLLPDATFLLLLEPDEALRRSGADLDRIEREGAGFLGEVDGAYRELAATFPDRIVTVDGDASCRRARDRDPWTASRGCLSRRRRSASCARRSPTGRRTHTCSTARAVSASGPRPSRSRRSCSATRRASSGGRIPTCTCSSRSATRSGSTRSASCGATSTCGRSRPTHRVYLILGADQMNEDAADALLKDLEEPPPYAVVLLVADDLGPLPETIRSRCQPVAFHRLSERAIREAVEARAPGLAEDERTALARVAAGRLDRLARLLDPHAADRRRVLLEVARDVYRDPAFEPARAASALLDGVRAYAAEAKAAEEVKLEGLELPAREAEQRARRAAFGAEREELLATLDELAAWYRDLVVAGAGAREAVVHVDRLAEIDEDGTRERLLGAERAAEHVRGALASGRGVQPEPAAGARGALRAPAARARSGRLIQPD